jgi:hypothetical protein
MHAEARPQTETGAERNCRAYFYALRVHDEARFKCRFRQGAII